MGKPEYNTLVLATKCVVLIWKSKWFCFSLGTSAGLWDVDQQLIRIGSPRFLSVPYHVAQRSIKLKSDCESEIIPSPPKCDSDTWACKCLWQPRSVLGTTYRSTLQPCTLIVMNYYVQQSYYYVTSWWQSYVRVTKPALSIIGPKLKVSTPKVQRLSFSCSVNPIPSSSIISLWIKSNNNCYLYICAVHAITIPW